MWIEYADMVRTPGEIFTFMGANRIGERVSLFWIAWAFVAEKAGNNKLADQIFQKGEYRVYIFIALLLLLLLFAAIYYYFIHWLTRYSRRVSRVVTIFNISSYILLFAAYYLLITAYYYLLLLTAICYILFTIYYLLLITAYCCFLLTVAYCYLLLFTHPSSLFTIYFLTPQAPVAWPSLKRSWPRGTTAPLFHPIPLTP
jgi:hypothetical protein